MGNTNAVSVDSLKHIEKSLGALGAQDIKDLPREHRRRIKKEAEAIALTHVFGADHKKDKEGKPIEQGMGSPGNQTKASLEAFKKYHDMSDEKNAADFKRMESEYAACEARRRAERQKIEAEEDAND